MKQLKPAALIRELARNRGDSIKIKSLLNAKPTKKDIRAEFKTSGKKRKTKSRPDGDLDIAQEPMHVLGELAMLGLVELGKDRVRVNDTFSLRGKVSMSPRGTVFVAVRGADADARDVFVPPPETGGALPGDEVEIKIRDKKRDRFEGKIVSILKRARQAYRMRLDGRPKGSVVTGTLLDTQGSLAAAISTDRIPGDTLERMRAGQVVIVRLPGRELRRRGEFFQQADFLHFEDPNDMDADLNRILLKYGLDPVYPPDIELPDPNVEPSSSNVTDWKQRRDLRGLDTITIDGATSKDFDDAISLETGSAGAWTLYVHIADVAYYVRPDTELDDEARERATSVYLADRVVPMLPPVLSENLCSLVAGKNRLAFTAEMDFNPRTGKMLRANLYRSVIKVDKRMTYESAEAEIHKTGGGGLLARLRGKLVKKTGVARMWELASAQRNARMKSGRIDLNLPEPVLTIKRGDDSPNAVSYRARLKSSMLIEEFMLSANQAVAEFLRKKNVPVLHRVHEPVDDAKLENLNGFLEIYGLKERIKDSSHRSITRALKAVADHPSGPVIERIFNIQLLRSFMQAKYQGDPLGHWGLGFKDYCHFTSPIRRYPDLVVHRALAAALARKKNAYRPDEIAELGVHTSERERHAMDAERDMVKIKMLRHIEREGMQEFTGFITGFKHDRVFMELDQVPVDGVVLMEHLTNDGELIQPDDYSVYVKKLSRPAFLGERWELELDKLDIEEMSLQLKPVWKKGMKIDSPFQPGAGKKSTRGPVSREGTGRRSTRSKRTGNGGSRSRAGGDGSNSRNGNAQSSNSRNSKSRSSKTQSSKKSRSSSRRKKAGKT